MQHRYLCSLLVQRKIMTVHVRWNKSLNLLTDCSVQTCQLYGHRCQVKILDNVKETSNLDKKIVSRKLIHVEQVCGLLKRIQGAHSGSKIASLRSCSDCKIHISETVTGIRYSCTYLWMWSSFSLPCHVLKLYKKDAQLKWPDYNIISRKWTVHNVPWSKWSAA